MIGRDFQSRILFAPSDGAGGGAGGGEVDTISAPPGAGGVEDTPPAWTDSLSDELRGAIEPKNWASADDAISAYLDLEKKIGADTISVPGDDASDEQRAAFYKALGRPDAAADYQLAAPEGATLAPETDAWWRETAHKHGLSQKQAEGLMADYYGFEKGQKETGAEVIAGEKKAAITALRADWGDQYDANIELGNLAVREVYGEGAAEKLAKSGDGRDPYFTKMAALAGASLAESGRLPGGGGLTGIATTPEQAKTELQALKSDKDFNDALLNSGHPQHRQAVERRERLYKIAHPENGR